MSPCQLPRYKHNREGVTDALENLSLKEEKKTAGGNSFDGRRVGFIGPSPFFMSNLGDFGASNEVYENSNAPKLHLR